MFLHLNDIQMTTSKYIWTFDIQGQQNWLVNVVYIQEGGKKAGGQVWKLNE